MDDLDRNLLRASLAVTLVCIAVVAYWLVSASQADASACVLFEGTPSELHGVPSVSWFPPGLTCTFQGGAFIDSPSYVRLTLMFISVIGLPFVAWLNHDLKRS